MGIECSYLLHIMRLRCVILVVDGGPPMTRLRKTTHRRFKVLVQPCAALRVRRFYHSTHPVLSECVSLLCRICQCQAHKSLDSDSKVY